MQRWGPYLQRCLWGINMGKLKLSQIPYPEAHCGNGSYQLVRVQVVSHMGNIWIGPWANFPQYMDPTFKKIHWVDRAKKESARCQKGSVVRVHTDEWTHTNRQVHTGISTTRVVVATRPWLLTAKPCVATVATRRFLSVRCSQTLHYVDTVEIECRESKIFDCCDSDTVDDKV